jgi:hypothetical protein
MKKAVFWDVALCRYCVNRRFGGTCPRHRQGIRQEETERSVAPAHFGSSLVDFLFYSILKKEAIRSTETSVNTISTRRHFPENGFLQDYPCLILCLCWHPDYMNQEFRHRVRIKLLIMLLEWRGRQCHRSTWKHNVHSEEQNPWRWMYSAQWRRVRAALRLPSEKKTGCPSETSLNLQTARRYTPQDSTAISTVTCVAY